MKNSKFQNYQGWMAWILPIHKIDSNLVKIVQKSSISFSTKDQLLKHLVSSHQHKNGVTVYNAPSTSKKLFTHFRDDHEGKMIYQCPKCPLKFTQTIDVQSHYQEVHKAKNPTKNSENYVKVFRIEKVTDSNTRSTDAQENVGMNSDLEDSSNEIDIKIEIKEEPVDESEEIIGIWLKIWIEFHSIMRGF